MRKKKRINLICNQAWTIYKSRKELYCGLIERGYNIKIFSEDLCNEKHHTCLLTKRTKNSLVNTALSLYNFCKYIYQNNKNEIYILYSTKINILFGSVLRLSGGKYICVVAGLGKLYSSNSLVRFIYIRLYAFVARGAQGVQVLNDHDYNLFSNLINANKIYKINCEGYSAPNIINFSPKINNNILMVSRLIKEKGVFEFLEAVKILRDQDISAGYNFYLVGKFDITHSIDNTKLRRLASEYGVDLVVGADNIDNFFEMADCFVFPSQYNEGMPRVLLEAAEHGSYIITSDNPGCKDFIKLGFAGKLIKTCPGDISKNIAIAIESYMKLDYYDKLKLKHHNALLTTDVCKVTGVLDVYEEIFRKCY